MGGYSCDCFPQNRAWLALHADRGNKTAQQILILKWTES